MALASIACAIIACIFALIVSDVSIRTLGYSPPAFTIALVEYGLLFFTMCAAPYLLRLKAHVFIEVVTANLPRPVQRILEKAVYSACLAATLIFAYLSLQLLLEAIETGDMDVRGVDMPMWLLFLPMPLSFGLMTFEFVRYLIGIDSMYDHDLRTVKDSV
jgi:TRAP-type C4-dicarboxylate transport system permease small subunit